AQTDRAPAHERLPVLGETGRGQAHDLRPQAGFPAGIAEDGLHRFASRLASHNCVSRPAWSLILSRVVSVTRSVWPSSGMVLLNRSRASCKLSAAIRMSSWAAYCCSHNFSAWLRG